MPYVFTSQTKRKKHILPLQLVRILDQLRKRTRYLQCSLCTAKAYVYWAHALNRFHALRHPSEMGKAEGEAFLVWSATTHKESPSTYRRALSGQFDPL